MREQKYDFWDSRLIDRPKTSNKMKVLDFKKVAEIIVSNKNIKRVEAGLLTDWSYTSVNLYENETVLTDMGGGYLGSNWATPAIIIEYKKLSPFFLIHCSFFCFELILL